MSHRQLYDLIQMGSPGAVLKEVQVILDLISSDFNPAPIISAFNTTTSLYRGRFPGYQACNTDYHDLRHTTDVFIAMTRIVHGAVVFGESLSRRNISLGLIAALLHDSGYIQEENDGEGTGAKYTADHVERSMDFFEEYGSMYRLSHDEIEAGRSMIHCTDLYTDISSIKFPSERIELLGKMLGTADLMAQMADRIYLEKLIFLHQELMEGGMASAADATEFFRNTVKFYTLSAKRLETSLGSTGDFMTSHFASRWNIKRNLYREAINKQKKYLLKILEIDGSKLKKHLKRGGIIDRTDARHGAF